MKTLVAKIFVAEAGALLIIGILMALSGCCKRPVFETKEIQVTEVVDTVETTRDSLIFFPGETLPFGFFIECDSVTNKPVPFSFEKKEGRVSTTITMDDEGRVSGRAECDSLAALLQLKDREIRRLRDTKEVVTKLVEVDKPTPWYDMAARWVAGIGVLFMAAKFYFRF